MVDPRPALPDRAHLQCTPHVAGNKCVIWALTIVLLDHTGERPLVLFSDGSLTVLAFTVHIPTFFDATENTALVVSAKGTSMCSCNAV